MSAAVSRPRRHLFIPEVVQTSAMDCGPAALTAFLAGHGLTVSYGRLRKPARPMSMAPRLTCWKPWPCSSGSTPSRSWCPWIICSSLKPRRSRRWWWCDSPAERCTLWWHGAAMGASSRSWTLARGGAGRPVGASSTTSTCTPRRSRLQPGAPGPRRTPSWAGCGGAGRPWGSPGRGRTAPGRGAGGPGLGAPGGPGCDDTHAHGAGARWRTRRGQQVTRALATFFARASQDDPTQTSAVPAAYWTVRPAPLLRTVRRPCWYAAPSWCVSAGSRCLPLSRWSTTRLPRRRPSSLPDLVAALEEPPSRPGRHLLRLLRADGLLAPVTLGLGMGLAAGGVLVEALLWRGLVDLTRHLGAVEQRLGSRGAPRLCECPVAPRPGERAGARAPGAPPRSSAAPGLSGQNTASGRPLLPEPPNVRHGGAQPQPAPPPAAPRAGGQSIRVVAELVCTAAGLVWLAPSQALLVVLAVLGMPALLLAMQPLLTERICASVPMRGRWAVSRSTRCWG